MTATHNAPGEGSDFAEGLPKSFVQSMRTLFDIMDDQHTGFVRFTDIERRWHEDGTQGLPDGVLASLRKVTPPDGFLSFDRFCAGLKMCLIKNKGKGDCEASVLNNVNLYKVSSLSPTNSLEAIGTIVTSSPQSSPHHHSRPLSAPLLDHDPFPRQPLTNGNLINGVTGTRKQSLTSHSHPKYDDIYHAEYTYQANAPSKNLPPPNQSNNGDANKIYATKSDIRMGIGGIKVVGKFPLSNQQNSIGPPKPPRVSDNEIYPQLQSKRSYFDDRMTNSLERESRAEKSWSKQRDVGNIGSNNTIRRERGGSLERLLDGGHKSSKQPISYGPPLTRTGMKSAIQSWFKERSKSDLQRGDNNNNYSQKLATSKQLSGHFYKDRRISQKYNPRNESAYRGAGDGGNSHLTSSSKIVSTVPPPPIGNGGPPPPPVGGGGGIPQSAGNTGTLPSSVGAGTVPPPPLITHSRNPSLPLSPFYTYNKAVDKTLYGKVMETATAVPINYTGNGHLIRSNNGTNVESTSGAIAHGLYVAPHAPQVAVHKKTSKKKEARRHTLQNGVDQNVMKRLRQLEAERDMFYQGLDVVERARTWYRQQLQKIKEQIQYLPFGPSKSEPSIETQQEKLHFQLARIHEINAHLRALMDASDKGLPTHMNLAIRGCASAFENLADKERTLDRLKQQNKLLTEEVSTKSERITSLEREKAALLRELFQARAKQRPANADSTFM